MSARTGITQMSCIVSSRGAVPIFLAGIFVLNFFLQCLYNLREVHM
jgi:hypothetical protein